MEDKTGMGLSRPQRSPSFGVSSSSKLEGINQGDLVELKVGDATFYGTYKGEKGNNVVIEDWGVDYIDANGVFFMVDNPGLMIPGHDVGLYSKTDEKTLKNKILRNVSYNEFLGKYVSIQSPTINIAGRLEQIRMPFYFFKPALTQQETPYGNKLRIVENEPVSIHVQLINPALVRPITKEDLEALVERSKEEYRRQNNLIRRTIRKLF